MQCIVDIAHNGSAVSGASVSISVPDQVLTETTNGAGKYICVLDNYIDGDTITITSVKDTYTGSAEESLDKASVSSLKNIILQENAVPGSITRLKNTTGNFRINWTWTNPDFKCLSYYHAFELFHFYWNFMDKLTKSETPAMLEALADHQWKREYFFNFSLSILY